MERFVDLCIVGAAGSGMAAAIAAKQAGAGEVLILEKQAAPGGCTIMSAGMMGVDTPVQKRQGLHYDPDAFYQELMALFNWNCDAKLVRKWILGSGENFSWLEELGLKYDIAVTETADEKKFRCTMHRLADWKDGEWHMKPQGPFLTNTLKEACGRYGVEILCKTRAKHLITDAAGAVVGVQAEDAEGKALTVHAKAVILCTGSISSNQQLIDRFYGQGEYRDMKIMANVPHNTGDGLVMAEEIGAAPGRISTLFIGPHNHFDSASELVSMFVRRGHNMKVNLLGERFMNEALATECEFGWFGSVSVDNQPGKVCWAILDQGLMDKTIAGTDYACDRLLPSLLDKPMVNAGGYRPEGYDPDHWHESVMDHVNHEAAEGRAAICRTLEEAAAYIGCPAEALAETVSAYNRSCRVGYDAEFLKPADYLYPVEQAPYYVFRGHSGIDTCLGGLKIDNHQRVLKPDGHCIPGLYAAGVLTSGWVAGLYAINGAEMSYTIFSGRSAAGEAVAYIKSK